MNKMKRKSNGDEPISWRSSRKRARSQDPEELEEDVLQLDATPSKRRSSKRSFKEDDGLLNGNEEAEVEDGEEKEEGEEIEVDEIQEQIPENVGEVQTPRKRGRPKGSKNTPKKNGLSPVKRQGGNLFLTPSKSHTLANGKETPSRHGDRSARRKSARAIIERSIAGAVSDEEDDELARHIYDFDEEEFLENVEDVAALDEAPSATETPSKRGRGRPKGSKNRHRSPTPPQDLPAHELYFSQNKSVHSKTSNNNLANLSLLTHEEYFTLARSHTDHHAKDLAFLQELHARSFPQWSFELAQSFSILLYGFGSKRDLLTAFATYISGLPSFPHDTHKIIIINGYLPNSSIRDILTTISHSILSAPQKLGSQPAEMLESVLRLLDESPNFEITLLINSIDSTSLRRPQTQTLLARLSDHAQVHLIATADHPNFPLLWDSSLRSTFNFVFHDCTTFAPYSAELDVVDEVHALLGRSGRRVGGKEGVAFVLKSLPVKARSLFGVLVSEQLAAMDESADPFAQDFDDNGDDEDDFGARKMAGISGGKREPGVEYRVLYQKAVEDFICPNEMTFRTLLKEFYDHQMITSKKDAMGTEMLSVPFRKEELETILEDIMS